MKYGKKIFKIEFATVASRYIRVGLNSGICYSGGDYHNWKDYSSLIYLAKSSPFDTWKVGDYLEIDLDKIHCSIREGQAINDTSIVRILDGKVAEEIKDLRIELYGLKNAKEELIPMLNNFSQKVINEDFFFSVFGIGFMFDESAVKVWKMRLDNMLKEFDRLKKAENDLEKERNDWRVKFNEKNRENEDNKEKYERVQTELNRLQNDEMSRLRGIISDTQNENTRLQERLESKSARLIEVTGELEDAKEEVNVVRREKENQIGRLELRLDEKSVRIQGLTSQLANLQIESNNKDNELRQKDEEIQHLKKWVGLSREELLREKIHLKEGKIGNVANQLGINLNQVGNLCRYYERLTDARKNYNQANIETHEDNITQIKETFRQGGVSIDDIQRLGRKCEKLAELRFELNQIQQEQYQAQQEAPTNH